MNLTTFLIDLDRPVAYYPKLTNITGSINATIFLCQLLYWEGKQINPDRWIYKTQEEIKKETGLSRREQETARKNLKTKGFLSEKLAGIPAKLHFKLNLLVINTAWDKFINPEKEEDAEKTSMAENAIQDCTKSDEQECTKSDEQECTKAPYLHIAENTQENTQENTTDNVVVNFLENINLKLKNKGILELNQISNNLIFTLMSLQKMELDKFIKNFNKSKINWGFLIKNPEKIEQFLITNKENTKTEYPDAYPIFDPLN